MTGVKMVQQGHMQKYMVKYLNLIRINICSYNYYFLMLVNRGQICNDKQKNQNNKASSP